MSQAEDDWAVVWSFLQAAQERFRTGVRQELERQLGEGWALSPDLPAILAQVRSAAEARFVTTGQSKARMTPSQFRRAWETVRQMVRDAAAEERAGDAPPITLKLFEG